MSTEEISLTSGCLLKKIFKHKTITYKRDQAISNRHLLIFINLRKRFLKQKVSLVHVSLCIS